MEGTHFFILFYIQNLLIYNKVAITEVVISEIGRSFAPGTKFAPTALISST
jgi:hypothetical protein